MWLGIFLIVLPLLFVGVFSCSVALESSIFSWPIYTFDSSFLGSTDFLATLGSTDFLAGQIGASRLMDKMLE